MLFLFIFCLAQLSWAADNPFRLEIVPPQAGEQAISFVIVVPPEHHVYRDMLKVQVLDDDGLNLKHLSYLLEILWLIQPHLVLRELYHDSPKIELAYRGDKGKHLPSSR